MEVQIARDGEVVGVLQLGDLHTAVAEGTILASDHAWHEGMSEWKRVSDLVAPASKGRKGAARKPAKEQKDWRQDPATKKQIDFLKSFGVAVAPNLKKGEASDLIDQYVNDPEAQRIRAERLHADREAAAERARRDRVSQGAFAFRTDVAKARAEVEKEQQLTKSNKAAAATKKKEIVALQKALATASEAERTGIEDKIEDFECDVMDLEGDPIDLQCYKEELKEAETVRIKLWKATFKEDWIMSEDFFEYDDFVDISSVIDRLHETYGKNFKSPTNKQIKDILESLDNASPDWDMTHPEAFFARLHQNYPSLMRTGATARSVAPARSRKRAAKGRGCILLLLASVALLLTFAFFIGTSAAILPP